jgi:hypothetical protein
MPVVLKNHLLLASPGFENHVLFFPIYHFTVKTIYWFVSRGFENHVLETILVNYENIP